MLVYGDRSVHREPPEVLNSISETVRQAVAMAGVERSDRLTGALIEAGELAQGLADAEFAASGEDEATPLQSAALALACAISRLLLNPEESSERRGVERAIEVLSSTPLPVTVLCRQAEGYAHYAVYPQAYAAAAARGNWPTPPLVIGLRSIGASLAAAVSVAAQAAKVVTLRPVGPVFRREIRASRTLRALLAAHQGPFAIVDEGPGFSGSSFAAVADLLASLGVTLERMVFMPSHGGEPGPQARPSDIACWRSSVRLVASAEDILAVDEVARLFADLIGPLRHARDISAGRWRDDLPAACRPPVWPAQERLKLRLSAEEGEFVARFAGLGRLGAEKFARARTLFGTGFVPEPLALRRGLLLERWVDGRPLEVESSDALISHLARYIGLRARCFPAPPERGADRMALMEMTLANAEELGGVVLRKRLANRLGAVIPQLSQLNPIYTDGRLHAWEWLWSENGRLLKTDALDHACGHDLIGAQDVAWDVAGAVVEFNLSRSQSRRLRHLVGRETGAAVPEARLQAFVLFYSAFQVGWWDMAAAAADTKMATAAAERRRFYAEVLTSKIGG